MLTGICCHCQRRHHAHGYRTLSYAAGFVLGILLLNTIQCKENNGMQTNVQVQKFLAEHQSRFQDWKLPAFDDVPDWKTFVHENIQKKLKEELGEDGLPSDELRGSLPEDIDALIQQYGTRTLEDHAPSRHPRAAFTAEL